MPLVESATVTECDLCGAVSYVPRTYQMAESRLPEQWVKAEYHREEGRAVFVFCSWSCLADYADEQDPTAQAMLVEGT